MTRKDREQAIADLTAEGWPLADIRAVLRDAATLTRLAEQACNAEPTRQDIAREQSAERRVKDLAARYGATVKFNGDPRGYVVKLGLPSGKYNTWGGRESGYGIG